MNNPRYQEEHEKLAELCKGYLALWETASTMEEGKHLFDALQLQTGMIVGQCANIYNLSPPGGLLNPNELFRKE